MVHRCKFFFSMSATYLHTLNNQTELATLNTNAVFVLFLFRKYNPTTINLECLCQISSFSWWRYTCIFDITGIVKVAVSTLIVYRVRFLYYKHVECADPDFFPKKGWWLGCQTYDLILFSRRGSPRPIFGYFTRNRIKFSGGGGVRTTWPLLDPRMYRYSGLIHWRSFSLFSVYTGFAACEYLVVFTNIAFHYTARLDFHDQYLSLKGESHRTSKTA